MGCLEGFTMRDTLRVTQGAFVSVILRGCYEGYYRGM